MNTTENLNSTETASIPVQPQVATLIPNHIIKPVKFSSQPHEYKVISLRECPTPESMQQCETPEAAVAYWRTHVQSHPYFNPECECCASLILNTRRRIKGHYLISIGTMDTILVHPREVFRLAIAASASAIVCAHSLCGAPHKLCYVERRFMCSD